MSDPVHPRVTGADRGDVVQAPGIQGQLAPYVVLSRCPQHSVGYYCETHQQPLANVGQLVMHVEDTEPHHVAVFCPVHLTYEAADEAQMRALSGASVEQLEQTEFEP